MKTKISHLLRVMLKTGVIMAAWLSQTTQAAETPVADHHIHIRSAGAAHLLAGMGGERAAETMESQEAAEAVEAMDVASIQKGLVLSLAYLFGSPDADFDNEYVAVRAENDYVANQVALFPDRLVGACSVNPLAEYALREIRRCSSELETEAFKFHFANSGVDLRNDGHIQELQLVFELLDELKLPAVVHLRTGNDDYGSKDADIFIDSVLSHVPDLPVQIAHMAGWGGYDSATDDALSAFEKALDDGRLSNPIWFDLGAVVFDPRVAGEDEELAAQVRDANETLAGRIRAIGAERVVFATDWPSWPPIPDSSQKLAGNQTLVEGALPLNPEELAVIYGNMVPWLD
jgi:predicted TIM-barrel fold metal-dependent hydrolase